MKHPLSILPFLSIFKTFWLRNAQILIRFKKTQSFRKSEIPRKFHPVACQLPPVAYFQLSIKSCRFFSTRLATKIPTSKSEYKGVKTKSCETTSGEGVITPETMSKITIICFRYCFKKADETMPIRAKK